MTLRGVPGGKGFKMSLGMGCGEQARGRKKRGSDEIERPKKLTCRTKKEANNDGIALILLVLRVIIKKCIQGVDKPVKSRMICNTMTTQRQSSQRKRRSENS